MLSQERQAVVLHKAERTFLDVIQAVDCNNGEIRDVWKEVLNPYGVFISSFCVRQPYLGLREEEGQSSIENCVHLLPSFEPSGEYYGHKQGLRIFMDQEMYHSCYEEQMILICLFLVIREIDREVFEEINEYTSVHELYMRYQSFPETVVTIRQALERRFAI